MSGCDFCLLGTTARRRASRTGLKNGQLLDAAEEAGFDVLITVDQSIPEQQNLKGRNISLVILCGRTNRLSDLTLLVPAAMSAIGAIEPRDVLRVR